MDKCISINTLQSHHITVYRRVCERDRRKWPETNFALFYSLKMMNINSECKTHDRIAETGTILVSAFMDGGIR